LAIVNEANGVEKQRRSRRWFLSTVASIFAFLVLSLCIAALVLLRKGLQPKFAEIVGSSMEPHLRGPRLQWTPPGSNHTSYYAIDSIKPNQPLPCQVTGDLDLGFDFDATMASQRSILPGDSVEYFSWKRVESRRKAASQQGKQLGNLVFRGLMRGDLVVIQSPDTSIREVKRIVGFPGDIVDIKEGDLWINGARSKRDIQSLLTQAILVESGDQKNDSYFGYGYWYQGEERLQGPLRFQAEEPSDQPALGIDTAEFRVKDRADLWNDLRWNAHDSHELISVNDFGIAVQVEEASHDWQLAVTLRSGRGAWHALFEGKGDTVTVTTDRSEAKSKTQPDSSARWLVVMRSDGDGIVGDQQSEWMRETLPESEEDEGESSAIERNTAPIVMQCLQGSVPIRQWLVFRDIHYRGDRDTAYQRLQANDGVVVLGDNVSLSSDSRQRWPDGLPLESIRGVVEQTVRGLPSLLKQREH
jgi:signal peptidase I